jgi:hypothetical protein
VAKLTGTNAYPSSREPLRVLEEYMRPTYTLMLSLAAATAVASPTPTRDAAWVSERVQQWQPTAKERSWENIGWAKDIRDALKLGKANNRPIFLFTHDGHLNVGRC